MTDVFGATPAANHNWGAYTFADMRPVMLLPNGAEITALAVHANNAGVTCRPKIVREVGGSSLEIVRNEASFVHAGGGYAWATLSTPFTVPQTGNYRVGWYLSGEVSKGETGSRASQEGDLTGTPSLHIGSYPLPCFGYRIGEGGSPPPPPPPPPPTGDPNHIIQALGQSNGNALCQQSGSLLVNTFKAIVPNCNVTLLNACQNSSAISQWAPGSSLLNNAIAQFNNSMSSVPNAVSCASFWYQGEGAAGSAALHYDEDLRTLITAYRAGINRSNHPIGIIELHANHESIRPDYYRVQLAQRLVCDPTYKYHIPNSFLISLADLDGTTDGVHLTSALLNVAARRIAAATGSRFIMP